MPVSDNPTTDEPIRIREFREEMGRMKLKGAGASTERWTLVAGIVLVVVGVLLGILGAVNTINAGDSPSDQRAFTASGLLLGILFVIVGAALFVRYSLGRFLRFWLIRLVYESRADTDRVVDAIERASGLEPAGPAAGSPSVGEGESAARVPPPPSV